MSLETLRFRANTGLISWSGEWTVVGKNSSFSFGVNTWSVEVISFSNVPCKYASLIGSSSVVESDSSSSTSNRSDTDALLISLFTRCSIPWATFDLCWKHSWLASSLTSISDDDLPLSRLLLGEDFLLESLLDEEFMARSSVRGDTTLMTSAVHLFVGAGGLLGWLLADERADLVSLRGDRFDTSPSSSSSSSIGFDIKLKTSADHLFMGGAGLFNSADLRITHPCSLNGSDWLPLRERFSSDGVRFRKPPTAPNLLRNESIELVFKISSALGVEDSWGTLETLFIVALAIFLSTLLEEINSCWLFPSIRMYFCLSTFSSDLKDLTSSFESVFLTSKYFCRLCSCGTTVFWAHVCKASSLCESMRGMTRSLWSLNLARSGCPSKFSKSSSPLQSRTTSFLWSKVSKSFVALGTSPLTLATSNSSLPARNAEFFDASCLSHGGVAT